MNSAAGTTGRILPGFEKYAVYEDGAIINIETGKQLKPYKNSGGYLRVNMRHGGRGPQPFVHRLVALAFVPNSKPKEWGQVNHINGDITDNRACNLEWCSGEYNRGYAVARQRARKEGSGE